MAWEKRTIDRMEMLRFLGVLYSKTAAGYGNIGLQTLMEQNAGDSVKSKRTSVTRAILESGLLLKQGYGRNISYKWNLKVCGPPSLPTADMLIAKAKEILCREKRETRRRKKNEIQL